MGGCLKGCLGRTISLVALVVAGVVAWQYAPSDWRERVDGLRAEVVELAGGLGGGEEPSDDVGPAATPELAETTLDRIERFRAGSAPDDRLLLGEAEVSSLIRHAFPGIVPSGVTDPVVEMRDGRLILSARVAVSAFPQLPSLEEVVGLLPDTVPIRMDGSLGGQGASTATLYVDDVQAARVPLPDRFIPRILEALGRQDREGLPSNAMLVPLPQGLRTAFVRQDSLVLVAGG